jgi:hypothetical protein
MRSDLVLRIVLSVIVPLLLFLGFFSLLNFEILGFYSVALSLIYFLLVFVFLYLRREKIKIGMFNFVFSISLYIFVIFLIFIMCVLTNIRIPYLYDLIASI